MHRAWFFAFGLWWSLFARVAHAGDPAPPLDLAPVTVPLPSSADEPTTSSPHKRDPSGVVTVLPTRPGEAKDAADLLTTSPGAVIQDAGGAGQRKSLSLRGAAPNAVLVLLDGVPLTGPGGAVDLSRIPTAALERLEVLRGGTSARYGPGAMGGVVNLVTKTPTDGARVFAEASHGSFVTSRLVAGATGAVFGGEGLVLLHGLRSQGDFWFQYNPRAAFAGPVETLQRLNNQALQGGGLLRYRTRAAGTTYDALLEGTAEGRGLAGTVQNPTADSYQFTQRGTASVRAVHPFADNGELSVFGWGRVDHSTLRGSYFGDGTTPYEQLESAAGAEVVGTRLVAQRHGLTGLVSAGADFLREPTAKNPKWGRLGVMVADEVLFDSQWALGGAVRLDVAGPFVVVSPKLGLTGPLSPHLELKANVGLASRPPGFWELYVMQGSLMPNPDLRPERAFTGDVSLSYKRERGAVSVTGYGSYFQDLISYEYYPPALARPYNFQAAAVAGAEVEASAKPWSWFEASAAYTFMASFNLKDDPRYYLKSLPNRPAHRFSARLTAGVPVLTGRAEVVVQSTQFVNRTETLSLPARAFVNVGIASTPWKDPAITVSVEVKNVLNVQTQDLDGYPLPPRAAFVSVAFAYDAHQK